MKAKLTIAQRAQLMELLDRGVDRDTIAEMLKITPGQVSAIAAHRTMGTYAKATKPPPLQSNSRSIFATSVPTRPKPAVLPKTSMAKEPRGSILLGFEPTSSRKVFWNPQPQDGSANPHVLILGESGYGKTYATSCLVTELVQYDVPSVIFDYGQGFSTANAPAPFSKWAHPLELELSRDGIAINPLEIFPVDLHGPATVAQRIADTFARVYPRIGVQQHAVIRRAVLDLLAQSGIKQEDRTTWNAPPPHFRNLERKLNDYTSETAPNQRRIASSAASHVSTLFVFDTFRSSGRKLSWTDLIENRRQVWILQLGGLESSVERSVTEFLLWNLIRFVEGMGPGPLRCFIVLDEAHKLSFSAGSPVEKLLREGRKFGLGLILASQQPEDFSSVAFANSATKIVFQVADERRSISRQLQRKIKNNELGADLSDLITTLPRGSAYVVTENIGKVVRIASFEERLVLWGNHEDSQNV